MMGITYFKRYRMDYELSRGLFEIPKLPHGYEICAWNDDLVADHAEAKFQSFRYEIDANVFPCLGEREGCLRLMNDISTRRGFVPQATWLIGCYKRRQFVPCATIQGIVDFDGVGSIQNVGVAPEHRGFGLGKMLLYQSLLGFQTQKTKRVTLEVTAQNFTALKLYEQIGFRTVRTVYKAVEVAFA
jgi:ribosomal protein S18 acetylase RimI-like enzyme